MIDYYDPNIDLTLSGCGFLGEFIHTSLNFIKVKSIKHELTL